MSLYAVLADLTLVVHALFVVFVAFGAVVARRRPWLRGLHLAALAYAVAVAAFRWVCPLTYLEDYFRGLAGERVGDRTFLARLLEPLLYGDLSPGLVLAAVLLVAGLSLAAYAGPGLGRSPDR